MPPNVALAAELAEPPAKRGPGGRSWGFRRLGGHVMTVPRLAPHVRNQDEDGTQKGLRRPKLNAIIAVLEATGSHPIAAPFFIQIAALASYLPRIHVEQFGISPVWGVKSR
jgi:hypothetical protein